MKAAIISLGSESSKMLAQAMHTHFDEVDTLDVRDVEVNLSAESEVLYGGDPIESYDCIYAKGSYKYEQLLSALTQVLQETTYLPLEANAFRDAHDKIYTHLRLQKASIPQPKTYLSASVPAARRILKKVNYPIMMKFPRGTQGKGVMFADSFASASSILDALDTLKQPFLIQEYVETGGVDIRLLVVGEKVIAGMKRKAQLGEERANIHAGGLGEAFWPSTTMQKIAVRAAKAIGAHVCAIDLLEGVKGPVVIEINASPGLQGITKATGLDVPGKIAKYLFEQANQRKQAQAKVQTKKIMSDIDAQHGHDLITHIDLRSERVLLPQIATKIAGFKEEQEVTLSAKKGEVIIREF